MPLLEAFKRWLDELAPQMLPNRLLGKAIAYTCNQWQYLSRYIRYIRYIRYGRSPMDNNLVERDIRTFCTGRKSWLFSDRVAGAKASAMVYRLMPPCRACGVEPCLSAARSK